MKKQKYLLVFAIVITLSFGFKTYASLTLSSTTVAGSGDVVVTSNGTTAGTFSVPSGASAFSNFLNVTGTLPTSTSAEARGVYFGVTSAGSSSSTQRAIEVDLIAGYTGSGSTTSIRGTNTATGTGNTPWVGTAANFGLSATSTGSNTLGGANLAGFYQAQNSSTGNFGIISRAAAATNSPAINVGIGALALNATVNVAGFFGIMTTAPTLSTTSALIADNGAVAADIFEARDNGTPVVTIADGGNTTFTGAVIKSINNSMTALAGGAQAGTAITKDISVIGTVVTSGDSVQLPAATAGLDLTIINRTATSMNVFPQTGDGINGLSANAAYAIAGNVAARCIAIGSSGVGVWECQKTAGR